MRVRVPSPAFLLYFLLWLPVHQPLAFAGLDRGDSALTIFQLPVVVPELVLRKVAVQMFLAD